MGEIPSLPLPPPRRARGQTIPEQIARKLTRAVLSGHYRPGDDLPAERLLAQELGTNRGSLREALRMLEGSGLFEARRGYGMRVLDFREHGMLSLFPAFVTEELVPLQERLGALVDVLRIRAVLMEEATAWAAEAHTQGDISRLRRIVAQEFQPSVELKQVIEHDMRFHRAIVQATHSALALWTLNTLAWIAPATVERMPTLWVRPPQYRDSAGAVVDTLEAGDSAAARTAIRAHYEAIDSAVAESLIAEIGGQSE